MRYRCATSAWIPPMISNPTSRGKTSEAVILAALARLGKHVLIPWGEERYDLALDEGGRLVRIQCKTGVLRKACIVFQTCFPDALRPLAEGRYVAQLDTLGVYWLELNMCYLTTIEAL